MCIYIDMYYGSNVSRNRSCDRNVEIHFQFDRLVNDCADIMSKTMSPAIVSQYYKVAVKCKQDRVTASCKRWLELNLIPQVRMIFSEVILLS